MTIMPLTHRARFSAWGEPFQPLDPGIIDPSIPAFFVGRDHDGFWLVRDTRGENGGVFLFKGSALAFARRTSGPHGCAIILLSERFELDVKNQGSPLAGGLKRLLKRLRKRGR